MFADPRIQVDPLMSMLTGGAAPQRVQTGVYTGVAFNFHNMIPSAEWGEHYEFDDEEEGLPDYGVVDSVEQFLTLFGAKIEAAKHAYAVGLTRVERAAQPADGGWRWRKWGEYFGKHKPHHEYLHDESEIDEVWTFSIVRRRT